MRRSAAHQGNATKTAATQCTRHKQIGASDSHATDLALKMLTNFAPGGGDEDVNALAQARLLLVPVLAAVYCARHLGINIVAGISSCKAGMHQKTLLQFRPRCCS